LVVYTRRDRKLKRRKRKRMVCVGMDIVDMHFLRHDNASTVTRPLPSRACDEKKWFLWETPSFAAISVVDVTSFCSPRSKPALGWTSFWYTRCSYGIAVLVGTRKLFQLKPPALQPYGNWEKKCLPVFLKLLPSYGLTYRTVQRRG